MFLKLLYTFETKKKKKLTFYMYYYLDSLFGANDKYAFIS